MVRQSTGNPVPVLLTRPLAQSQEFAAALADRFDDALHPVISPLMEVELLTPDLPPEDFVGVIFTSATGVEASVPFAGRLPTLAYCVGARTAKVARAAGFTAISADGNADALVDLIIARPPGGRLLHLRGEETRGEVAERLTTAGIGTVSMIVYRQRPLPLTGKALELLANTGVVIVPLFSPRSAALMSGLVPVDHRADVYVAAMSRAVADAVRFRNGRLIVAARPDAAAMLDALAKLIDPYHLP
jgi:uroporphyrinogen-III synthase